MHNHQKFYLNDIHKSVPDLSNSSDIEIKAIPIPLRMFKIFGTQDSESERMSLEQNVFTKSRFHQIDIKNLSSVDSFSINNQNNPNLNKVKSIHLDPRNFETNTDSDYSDPELMSPLIKPPSLGISPINSNRFIRIQTDEKFGHGFKTLARTLSMPLASQMGSSNFTQMNNYINQIMKAELSPADSELDNKEEQVNLGRFVVKDNTPKEHNSISLKHDQISFENHNRQQEQNNKDDMNMNNNLINQYEKSNRFSLNGSSRDNKQINNNSGNKVKPKEIWKTDSFFKLVKVESWKNIDQFVHPYNFGQNNMRIKGTTLKSSAFKNNLLVNKANIALNSNETHEDLK